MPLLSPQIPRGPFRCSAVRDRPESWYGPLQTDCSMSFRNVGVLCTTIPIFVSWKPQNAFTGTAWFTGITVSEISIWNAVPWNELVYLAGGKFNECRYAYSLFFNISESPCSAHMSKWKSCTHTHTHNVINLNDTWSLISVLRDMHTHTHTHTHTHIKIVVCAAHVPWMKCISFIILCLWELSDLFFFNLNCDKQLLASSCLSVCMEQLGSHRIHCHEIWHQSIFRKSVVKIQISLTSTWITSTLHEGLCTFYDISLKYSDNEKCFRQKLYSKPNTRFIFSNFFPPTILPFMRKFEKKKKR